ncbi:hypothetical protein V8B97DRAFT_908200 [Scleroderma yunnanense]
MHCNILPSITFTPTAASFPFPPKRLFLSQSIKVPLESQTSKQASSDNGIFPPGLVSLSAPHAEVWIQGKHVIIRDRGSSYGTRVNGIRIENQTLLQDGDIITLGEQLSRSSGQRNASEVHLKPIEAVITIIGV